jgi:hypothetical protein
MEKPKNIAVVMLFAFMGILAMPLLSAPAAPSLDHSKSNVSFFENGDEHTNQWLIRSISETEEHQNTSTSTTCKALVLHNNCINHHSTISKVLFAQAKERKDIKVPKAHIYLSNSCLTI